MNISVEKFWPPTKTYTISALWAFVFGFFLQIALPLSLNMIGATRVALFAMLPGLLPILWATGGWFAGIAPLGYVVMYSINTVVYASLLLVGIRGCVCLRREFEK